MTRPCFALQLFGIRHRLLMEYMHGKIGRRQAQRLFEASGLANYAVAILLDHYKPREQHGIIIALRTDDGDKRWVTERCEYYALLAG